LDAIYSNADFEIQIVLSRSRTFPLDWSLKTKVRFVTSSSLSWCGLLRGTEESRGSDAFTACSPLATASQLQVLITSDGLTNYSVSA